MLTVKDLRNFAKHEGLQFSIEAQKTHVSHVFGEDEELTTGFVVCVRNVYNRKNGDFYYYWFKVSSKMNKETLQDEMTEDSEVTICERFNAAIGKSVKRISQLINVEIYIEDKIKSYNECTVNEALNVINETITEDSEMSNSKIYGNSFYRIEFNNDNEDFLIIDSYSLKYDKEEITNEINSRKDEITFIGYFEGYFEKVYFGKKSETKEEEEENSEEGENTTFVYAVTSNGKRRTYSYDSEEKAVKTALNYASKKEIDLFSVTFSSFGTYYDSAKDIEISLRKYVRKDGQTVCYPISIDSYKPASKEEIAENKIIQSCKDLAHLQTECLKAYKSNISIEDTKQIEKAVNAKRGQTTKQIKAYFRLIGDWQTATKVNSYNAFTLFRNETVIDLNSVMFEEEKKEQI